MAKKLFLLDGMALVYRAHFAFIRNPILSSSGQNTSAIFGFLNTLLDILKKRTPTHIAIALDTREPTERHKLFPEYKAQREAMPEDIAFALPHIERFAEAFNIPVLKYPGYEADDIIGTFARLGDKAGYHVYMVTPDKDFAQLVSPGTRMLKPGRRGGEVEIVDVDAVQKKWLVKDPAQVADVLGLWGDASDNIPGVPGFGETTAKKLIGQYGNIENLIAHIGELKGKQKERLKEHQDAALLSKKLTTIQCTVPVKESLEDLLLHAYNEKALKNLFAEFEFRSMAKRLFGEEAPHGTQLDFFSEEKSSTLKTLEDVEHEYQLASTPEAMQELAAKLEKENSVCFDLETDSLDVRTTGIVGLAFSTGPHLGFYVPVKSDPWKILDMYRPFFGNENIEKTGHNLKFDLSVLAWHGVEVKGAMFDTMLAHFLVEPDQRHGMDVLAERFLEYVPIPITRLIGDKKKNQRSMRDVPAEEIFAYAAEDADVTIQLREHIEPLLKEKGQERVFYEIEMPLLRVLIDMEREGIRLDVRTLEVFSKDLEKTISRLQSIIFEECGCEFNLNSPKQLGEVLFDKMKLVENPKKTATGQFATSEPVLQGLAHQHQIVQLLLDYREAAKLKSTYVDALPTSVFEKTGRIHSTFSQTGAITGRLASNNPNLQNIPIRSEMGQEIRRAFVPRDENHVLLSADYSQIELRVMAEMSGDEGMREAFEAGYDIHTATAARIYDVALDAVVPEMRRKAKMVNFGIIFGISPFGLSQRLGVPRREAQDIIEQYFKQYPRVKQFMKDTIAFCREHAYVETMTGRRRYIRDINSRNKTTQRAAERIAINSPIQGTAADMIKMAMITIHDRLKAEKLNAKMLLHVHDELVFDVPKDELGELKLLVTECMQSTIEMNVPVVVDVGVGDNWLKAHS